MADREEIARRHGVGHLAHKLVGETAAELEADAAARAAILRMLSPAKPEHAALVNRLHPGTDE